jgi:hypothetical protein|tara:strand:- start:27351 stop:27752 length:402 start_codon:yes stop_codon:yes gene_type:complete
MNNVIIGTTFVGGYLGWKALSNMESYRAYLDEKYGRKMMDAVGYLGGALQLGAVVGVSRGWVSNTSFLYHGISFVGSSGLLATAYYHNALAPVLVNMIWMGMNVVGMIEGISNQAAIDLIVDEKSYLPTALTS